jgi:hypothetical protein
MVIKTSSPGVLVNEVDLTRGTSDAITTNVGAFAGPFQKGPVDEFVLINTENDLELTFGKPTDENYEYWWTVSNFLNYGGVCYVVRCDDSAGDEGNEGGDNPNPQKMRNASSNPTIKLDELDPTGPYVKNEDHFTEDYLGQNEQDRFIARTPGEWGNSLAVTVIDAGADFQMNLSKTGIVTALAGSPVPDGTLYNYTIDGGTNIGEYIKLKATNPSEIGVDSFVTHSNGATGIVMNYEDGVFQLLVTGGTFAVGGFLLSNTGQQSGEVTEIHRQGNHVYYKIGSGGTSLFTNADENNDGVDDGANLFSENELDILAEFTVDGDDINPMIVASVWKPQSYTMVEGNNLFGWPKDPRNGQKVRPETVGVTEGPTTVGDTYVWDGRDERWYNTYVPQQGNLIHDTRNVYTIGFIGSWYDNQIAFQGIPWYRFASRPGTTADAFAYGSKNDEMHAIVYDSTGELTGSKGNVLEEYFNVSKLSDATKPEGERNYYISVINQNSQYIYANKPLNGPDGEINTGLASVGTSIKSAVECEYIFCGIRDLSGGVDQLKASLAELQSAYSKYAEENTFEIDYILQGPAASIDGSSSYRDFEAAVAKANFLISIVEQRRDCMCFLSPPRYMCVTQKSANQITEDIATWADELSSSSYACIDSGYKYTYDRFREAYVNVPLNGDTAGTLVYTSFRSEPWFSPAGFQRGQVRNVVKLPYNPNKAQRDVLYSNRVNPVVTFPGEGTVLFGDKTALGYSSAFDRINVRRLFLVVEREIAKLSKTTLFEFNDETTRALFKNNVNPFLRDVQSKRGMYDFLVVCDETNNTPEIIDRNEFVADIYIKPSRSINYITLNFIATKTGMAFDEAVGLFRRNSF